MSRKPITPEQLAALRAYARLYGRTWKQELRSDWMSACASVDPDIAGLLQQLRNTHGPSWLVAFRLPPRQWMLCPDCEQSFPVAPTVPAHTWLHQPCPGSHTKQ